MNVSFEKTTVATPVQGVTIDVETTAAPAAEATPAPAAQGFPTRPACNALATREDSPHAIFDDSNIGFEDINLPRINMVQKVGRLSEIFVAGEIVLDQSAVLYTPSRPGTPPATPLTLVVIGFKRTSFVEKVPGGAMGLVCRTRDEVVAKGGTLDYAEWQESVKYAAENPGTKPLRRFDYMTTALVLVEKPEAFQDPNKSLFPYSVDGKQYCMAFFTMKSSAYNRGAKTIFTNKKTRLIENPAASYSDIFFTLGTEMGKFNGAGNNSAIVPDIRAGGPATEGIAKLIAKIKGVA